MHPQKTESVCVMPFDVCYPADPAERVEGTPFYDLADYTLTPPLASDVEAAFSFRIRAFRELPFCDAVGLLMGDDQTGHIVWSGALAMIEWLVRGPSPRAAALLSGSALCVELGGGCGVVTVALAQYVQRHQQKPPPGLVADARLQLLCTDGNASCVDLARANIDELCVQPESSSLGSSARVSCAADVLRWGEGGEDYDALFRQHGVHPGTWSGSFYLLSADVIYSEEAIPLLVSTARTLHSLLLPPGCTPKGASSLPTTWWILYTPRSLTLSTNVELFTALLTALEAQSDWRVTRHALPPSHVVTGFEAHVAATAHTRADADRYTDALLGCVLEVQLGGA